MKLTLNREKLEKKLQSTTAAMGKTPINILEEALMQVKKDRLYITSSNGEVQLTVSVPCDIDGEAHDFVCDVKTILRTITSLKSDEVIIEIIDNDLQFYTTRTRNKYSIAITHDPADFPLLNKSEWSESLSINGAILSSMIKKASLIVNPDSLRQGMQGIQIKMEENCLAVNSVNEQVICSLVSKFPEDFKLNIEDSVVIPKATANVIAQFETSPKVNISFDKIGRSLRVHDGSTALFVILVNGQFPNIKPFKDSHAPDVNMTMPTEELSLATRRLSIFSNEYRQLIFDTKGENLLIEAKNLGFKKNGEELIELSHKSPEMAFRSGVNSQFLSVAIGSLAGENISISQVNKSKQFFLTDDSSEGYETLWIIAPVVLNESEA